MVAIDRAKRIAEQMRNELGRILLQEAKDPRFKLISISDLELSRDLSHAKVFFTIAASKENTDATVNALNKASSFMRVRLAEELNLRITPKLRFIYDVSVEEGRRLSALIDQAIAKDSEKFPGVDDILEEK